MIALAVVLGGCDTARPPVAHQSPSTSKSAGPSLPPGSSPRPLARGLQRGWVHGVGVDAPAEWKLDALHCGVPVADTLIVTTVGYAPTYCLASPPAGVSFAWLGSYQNGLHPGLALGHYILSGRQLARLRPRQINNVLVASGQVTRLHGQRVLLVVVPHRHVFLFVSSPHPDAVAKLVDSLQAVDVDPDTGCRTFTRTYDDVASLPAGSSRTPVPGAPTSTVACYYVDGWLEATGELSSAQTSKLVVAIDVAPRARISHSCDKVRQGSYAAPGPMLLQFRYPSQAPVSAVARIFACHGWQSYVSNGRSTRRMTLAVLHAIPRLWGYLLPPGVK
ncbi:MAG: hypothetical protein JO222_13935 [Frankiales bacterium]|nr:hypothetical protein [Frankiales bacterium]